MATQHTPGPWLARFEKVRYVIYVEAAVGEKALATTGGAWPDSEANARLIAASPELLDLAYQYLSDLRRPPTGDSLQRRIERAEAIIAKATGQ